jgi:hypothetical protein
MFVARPAFNRKCRRAQTSKKMHPEASTSAATPE